MTRRVRVIPILVDGARMPHAEDLPDSLAKLVRRQALELSPARFEFDTSRLLKVLDSTLADGSCGPATRLPTDATTRTNGRRSPCSPGDQLVGMPGFEPGASTSRTWRAAKLRYIPFRGGSVPQAGSAGGGVGAAELAAEEPAQVGLGLEGGGGQPTTTTRTPQASAGALSASGTTNR